MLEFAQQEAETLGLSIAEVVWVPGAMEIPLALERQLRKDEIDAAACLGIIEKGQTKHGLAMGQAVTKAIVDLQLKHDKPIGLGIIGPGAKPEHIEPRIEPHARAAISAISSML
jgi:6,7-dimethyl-8-ribityllumazine synthase